MPASYSVSNFLEPAEIRELQERSNWRAGLMLAFNWGLIIGAFAMAILAPNPITIILAILILGGRQLGLGIIVHDCGHNAMFTNKKVNEFVGQWLGGAAVNIPLAAYRDYHNEHHRHAGTERDPDIILVKNYPVTRDSLKRKFTRDLTGQTGFRDTLRKIKSFKLSENYPWLLFHIALLTVLTVIGAPWAYLLWWAAELFVYPAVMRFRHIGEHGVVLDRTDIDPRNNTSTTIAPFWQRLFLAPNNVNYHLEHHLMAGVPPYKLKAAHLLLKERGFHDGFACMSYGYGDVLRRAVRAD